MRQVRSRRRRLFTRGVLGVSFAAACAGLLALGVGLLPEGERAADDGAHRVTAPAVAAESNAFRAPSPGVPQLQLPSVPSVRPAAEAIDTGIAVAVGIALLAYLGLVAPNGAAFRSRRSLRIAPRAPPRPAFARL